MTTLEKAARAMCASVSSEGRWDKLSAPARKNYLKHARAVLMAVREPTEGMLGAGGRVETGSEENHFMSEEIWTAMIDAILNEEPK